MKSFKELGIRFQSEDDCVTCDGKSCHNNVPNKDSGIEYNVHIQTFDDKLYDIYAHPLESTDSSETLSQNDLTEEQAVKFICDHFEWFHCA